MIQNKDKRKNRKKSEENIFRMIKCILDPKLTQNIYKMYTIHYSNKICENLLKKTLFLTAHFITLTMWKLYHGRCI